MRVASLPIVLSALTMGSCDRTAWPPSAEELAVIEETIIELAGGPRAYPGVDLSSMRVNVVHSEVAVMHGTMEIVPDDGRESFETYTTLVFLREAGEWRFDQSWSVGRSVFGSDR